MKKNFNSNKYFSFLGKKYSLNFNKLKEVCLSSSNDGGNKEFEISQAYETDENGELKLSNKVEHETRIIGNQQNDMIVYDIVKLLIISLLENSNTEESFELDFGTCLTINTLIDWGIIYEVE